MTRKLYCSLLCAFALWLFPAYIMAAQHVPVTMEIDGHPLSFDVAPQILDGRTSVPSRFVSESLGAMVEWDPAMRMVRITTSDGDFTPLPGFDLERIAGGLSQPLYVTHAGDGSGGLFLTERGRRASELELSQSAFMRWKCRPSDGPDGCGEAEADLRTLAARTRAKPRTVHIPANHTTPPCFVPVPISSSAVTGLPLSGRRFLLL